MNISVGSDHAGFAYKEYILGISQQFFAYAWINAYSANFALLNDAEIVIF